MIPLEIAVLAAASLSDIRTHEVPIIFTPIACVPQTIYLFTSFRIEETIYYMVCAGVIFLSLYLFMRVGDLGGADVLMSMTMGLYIGIYGMWAVLFGFILSLPYTAWMKYNDREREYPFVPFLFGGFIVTLSLIY